MILVAAGATVALVAPLVEAAAGAAIVYYTPPHMLKQGTSVSAISGDGKVVLKVLVNADGTFKVQSIILSTNHADDAAAMEIAKSSTYAPAKRGDKKLLAFYDYTLIFKGGGAQAAEDQPVGELGQYERELRAGNYSGAQTSLKAYVLAHADEQRAQLDLGIADTYLADYEGGSGAFDKAGTVPAADHSIAAKAYIERAIALLNAKDVPGGLAAAKHAAAFDTGFASEDTLGVAELQSGDAASAVTDLQKAHDLAKADATIATTGRVANDIHITQADLATGDTAGAQKASAEAVALDPKASTSVAQVTGAYYADKAEDARKAGKLSDAGALYLQAAGADPASASVFYVNAAFTFLKMMPADDQKAKDSADKALAANPNDASANYAEGIALADQGKKDAAATALAKADSLAKAAGNTDLAAAIERAQKQLSGATSQ
jgi:tetratricopeptide (TPR) repeat protein